MPAVNSNLAIYHRHTARAFKIPLKAETSFPILKQHKNSTPSALKEMKSTQLCLCLESGETFIWSILSFSWNGRLQLFPVSRLETLWFSGGGPIRAGAFLQLRSEGVKGFLLHQCLLLHFCGPPGINIRTPPHTCLCVCTHSNNRKTVYSF